MRVSIRVRPLAKDERDAAASLLARGMGDNPNHVHAFGEEPARRCAALERMFRMVVAHQCEAGNVLGAFRGSGLAGVCGLVPPGRCPSARGSRFAALSALVLGSGLRHAHSVLEWLEDWAATDPERAHWHLGPAAVEPGLRGQGIGSAMLKTCCGILDAESGVGYLENDRPENLAWLRRFGFEVMDEHLVLRAPNWFMLRPPAAGATAPRATQG